MKEKIGLRNILIENDMEVVREVQKSVEVIYEGKIVENGKRKEIYREKMNKYRREIID